MPINKQEQNKPTEYEHWESLLSEFHPISFHVLKQDRRKPILGERCLHIL